MGWHERSWLPVNLPTDTNTIDNAVDLLTLEVTKIVKDSSKTIKQRTNEGIELSKDCSEWLSIKRRFAELKKINKDNPTEYNFYRPLANQTHSILRK